MGLSRIKNIFIGNPLTMDKMEEEKIPKRKALAVLSSDALSSVAYATEEVLISLSLFAISAMVWSMPDTHLHVLESPYRSVLGPLLKYIDQVHAESGKEMISVVVPEFITKKWYQQFLHHQMTLVLRTALKFRPGKVVTAIKYYL